MRKIIELLIIFIFLFSTPLFATDVDFDLDKIVSDANKTDKEVLLFFHKDGCSFCEKTIFDLEDENISKLIDKDFIFVDINKDDEETISFDGFSGTTKEFLKELGVELYPTIAFIDGNGIFIYQVTGYRNKKLFTNILNYIKNHIYEKITFEEFEDDLLNNE